MIKIKKPPTNLSLVILRKSFRQLSLNSRAKAIKLMESICEKSFPNYSHVFTTHKNAAYLCYASMIAKSNLNQEPILLSTLHCKLRLVFYHFTLFICGNF